jgi:hypothetical protein
VRWLLWTPLALWFAALVTASLIALFGDASRAGSATEVLATLASWPVAAVVVLIMLGGVFQTEVRAFAARVTELQLGAATVRAQQPPASSDREPSPIASKTKEMPKTPGTPAVEESAAPASITAAAQTPPASTQPATTTPAVPSKEVDLREPLRRAQREGRYWYSRWLGQFLQPLTIDALRWIVGHATPFPYSEFIEYLKPKGIADPNQQAIIWSALSSSSLVRADGQMIKATRSAHIFLRYIDGKWRPLDEDWPSDLAEIQKIPE